MDDLVATFSTLARVEEMRAAKAAKQGQAQSESDSEGAQAPAGKDADVDTVRELFARLDANGDGR